MAERLAPVDENVMPYAPIPRTLTEPTSMNGHHLAFKRLAPELADDGGQAVRILQVLDMDIEDHDEFHHEHMGGLERFAETDLEKVGYVVNGLAEYLAREGVVYGNGMSGLRHMTDAEYMFVRAHMHVEIARDAYGQRTTSQPNAVRIGEFLGNYVRAQGFEGVPVAVLDRFRLARSRQDIRLRGQELMSEAVKIAAAPLEHDYAEIRRAGLLRTRHRSAAGVIRASYVLEGWRKLQTELRGQDLKAA